MVEPNEVKTNEGRVPDAALERLSSIAEPSPATALQAELDELDLPETLKRRLSARLEATDQTTDRAASRGDTAPAEASPSSPGGSDGEAAASTAESTPSSSAERNDLEVQLAALREELRKAEARYSTLQGKYDAETAALRAALAQLQAPKPDAPAPAQQPRAPVGSTQPAAPSDREVIRQQLRDRYGQTFEDDVIDLVAEAAELAERRALERVQQDLTKTREELSSVRIRAVEAQLDATIPEWRRVVNDPQFGAWLDSWDPVSRSPRRDALVRATMAGDAVWVADILGAYMSAAQPSPAAAASQSSAPRPSVASSAPSAPSAPSTPPAPRAQIAVQPAAQPVVTRQTLKQLVTAAARTGDIDKLEAQFDAVRAALLNGRYTE
jgi:hypothetical protein